MGLLRYFRSRAEFGGGSSFSQRSFGTLKRALYLLLAAFFINSAAVAVPGDLDTTFSADGRVFSSFSNAADYAWAVAVQADGKIVAAGGCGGDFCVVRYTATGGLDSSFNGNGRVSNVFGSSSNEARALLLQPDGKVLLAGSCSNATVTNEVCLARFTATGALDTTFNSTGIAKFRAGAGESSARSLALQADGKILIGALCDTSLSRSAYCILRLTSNGAPDSTFAGDGQAITAMGDTAESDQLHAVLVQADGKIVATGRCGMPPDQLFCVARFTSSGSLDFTFGLGGKARFIAGSGGLTNAGGAAALQPDGKIVLASICVDSGWRLCVARLTTSGVLDTSFSTDGVVLTTINSNDVYFGGQGVSVALQTDGKIVVTRPCSTIADQSDAEFCVVRYHGSGALDTNFDVDGRVQTSMTANFDQPNAVAIQSDGKIVVAGYCAGAQGSDICVARMEGGPFDARNCSLDIDGDGKTLVTVDGLIASRVMLGLTGSAVTNGITFAAHAARDEWGTHSARDIRKYLITQCGMQIP